MHLNTVLCIIFSLILNYELHAPFAALTSDFDFCCHHVLQSNNATYTFSLKQGKVLPSTSSWCCFVSDLGQRPQPHRRYSIYVGESSIHESLLWHARDVREQTGRRGVEHAEGEVTAILHVKCST